ncbi:MAG TPA: endonuclease III [Myxococcota bacterium]|nr:endonuclease III [Myxococcota bacterium]
MRESQAARRARASEIVKLLEQAYPDAACALAHHNPFELLVATILSAQCTDKMVNQVTPRLFARYPDAPALANAPPAEVERIVQPTGFFRQKTKSIQAAARDIVERFGGTVPGTLEALLTLRGVGRKTANVVLGDAFGVPGLTVDTHMARVNRRLGLTRHEDPQKIERDLMELVPREQWTLYSHRVIQHGRVCCHARRPECERCPLRPRCPWPDSRTAQARSAKKVTRRKAPARGRKRRS